MKIIDDIIDEACETEINRKLQNAFRNLAGVAVVNSSHVLATLKGEIDLLRQHAQNMKEKLK